MNTQLPAYLRNLPQDDLAETALANIGMAAPPHLSIQGNRFTLVDIAGNAIPIPTLHVDTVIIDINNHVSKIFFGKDKPYDPNNPTPPLCFSDNGVAPSMSAGQPQSPTCASCGHNVWGSKISQMGSAVKQCADQQKVAVFIPEHSEGMFLLRIPPGSFANWRAYMAKFQQAKISPRSVVTRISFEPNVVGTLSFASPGYISEKQAPTVLAMISSHAADAIIGKLDRPREGALPAPQQQAALPTSAQSAAPAAPFTPSVTQTTAQSSPAAPAQTSRRGRPRRQADPAAAQAMQPQPQVQSFQPGPVPGTIIDPGTAMGGGGGGQAPFQPSAAPTAPFGIAPSAPPPPAGLNLDEVFK